MNKNIKVYSPLILSFVLLIGMYLGSMLRQTGGTVSFVSYSPQNKLNLLIDLIETKYVDSIPTNNIVENAIDAVLEDLDPHSVYIPAKDLKQVEEPLKGNFEGIGVQFNIQDDTIMVVNTISGGPSEKVGILPGDRIVTINDSIFTGSHITNDDVIKNLKGERGTKVNVGIARFGEDDLLHFTITRDKIPLYSVDISYMLTDDIGYIKLSRFSQTSVKEIHAALTKLKKEGMKKLVFDLRSNGGGYLDAAIEIADEFLSSGKLIVYTESKTKNINDYFATSSGSAEHIEVAILIDSYSASASEIVAGAIQDNDRGVIIGQRSFGKGLVQESTMFKDGSAVRLTIARYYTPTGRCIQRPYTNGKEEYYHDIQERMSNGELRSADSIVVNDSLKYTTPKGKIVYGGGGIVPDIFIPVDTFYATPLYSKIRNKGLIYKFALQYTDTHREALNIYEDYQQLCKHLDNENIYQQFLAFIEQQGIDVPGNPDLRFSNVAEAEVMAYISRNILNDEGFYPIIHKIDNTLKRTIEYFTTQMDDDTAGFVEHVTIE